MNARDEILARIQRALADRPTAPPIERSYRGVQGVGQVARFIDRLLDYHAAVHRSSGNVARELTDILAGRGIDRVVIPDGFPRSWAPTVDVPHPLVDVDVLDEVNAVLTVCAVAIAETGTIVLDAGPGMGRRETTLVPDYHLVVVQASQIVVGVPDAIAALDARRPLTWISGPSATSDIELNRVEGVHGPRTLEVLIV